MHQLTFHRIIDLTDVGSRSQPSFVNPDKRAQEHGAESGASLARNDVEIDQDKDAIVLEEVRRSAGDVGYAALSSSSALRLTPSARMHRITVRGGQEHPPYRAEVEVVDSSMAV